MKKLIRVISLIALAFLFVKTFQIYQDVKQVMTYQAMVQEVLAENDTAAWFWL